jgi:midasin
MRTGDEDEKKDEEKGDGKDDSEEPEDKPQEKDQKESADEEKEEDQINEDKDDDYRDKPQGVDVREEEKENENDKEKSEEMPEQDDEQDGDEGENAQNDMDAGDNDPDDRPQNDEDELPENMQLDGDDADADADADAGDEDPQDGEEERDELDPPTEDPDTAMDEEKENDDADAGDDGDEDDEQHAQAAGGGMAPENPEEDAEKPPEDEKPDEPTESKKHDGPDAFGVTSNQGKDSVLPTEQQMPEEKDADAVDPSQGPKGEGGLSEQYGDKGESQDVGSNLQNDQRAPQDRRQKPPNPFQQAGDLNEQWHRRLNLVDPEDEEGKEDDMHDDSAQKDSDGKGLFEKIQDEDAKGSDQVLDSAADDQVQELQGRDEKEKSEQPDDEMKDDKDNAAPMEDSEEIAKKEERKKRERDAADDKEPRKKPRDNAPAQQDDPYNHDVDDADADDDDDSGMDLDSHKDEDSDDEKAEPSSTDQPDISEKIHSDQNFRFGEAQRNVMNEDDEHDEENAPKTLTVSETQMVSGDMTSARDRWLTHRAETEPHAMRLSEQLRLILEPTLASRLQGDYRTGKRLNMRRIIGYVASGFRKDKIWLRRTKPAKREYQVMIMIDDSSSMGEAGPLALSSLAMISTALTRLEVGELSVVSFADSVKVVHPFGKPFNEESGAHAMSQFEFTSQQTLLGASLEAVRPIFQDARSNTQSSASSGTSTLQLCFVVSDARIDSDNRARLDSVVRSLAEDHVLVVMVIIDKNDNPRDSIFNTRTVEFRDNKVVTSSYFDNFPFPYYVTIQKLEGLPDVLSDALKQWFTMISTQMNGK